MIDLHSHILPGLDDGAGSLEESLRMCEMSYRDGVRTIVATPHTLNGVYQNNRSTILAKVRELRTALEESPFLLNKRQNETALVILPGADVHLSQETLTQLDQGKVTTLGDGGKSLLIEFPAQRIPHGAEQILLQLIERGIIPVITHPERNQDVLQRPQRYRQMIMMGCLGQVTAISLTGGFSHEVKYFSQNLLKHKLLHVIASDAHSTDGRSPVLTSAVEAAAKIVGKEEAWRMVTDYPQAILEGLRPDKL
jgi:protein-tyrosine phosphatase